MKKYDALILLLLGIFLPSARAASISIGAYVGSFAAIGFAVLAGTIVKHNKLIPVYTPEPDSLNGKTIVITGANTGLGLESAKRLAAGGAKVVLTVRSDAKGEAAVQAVQDFVKKTTGQDATATYKVLHLNNLNAIRAAVASWDDIPTIDVLLNNAGIFGKDKPTLTDDRMEMSFQVNHLGHFFLTNLLKGKLLDSARIINVSSEAFSSVKSLDFDYVWEPSQESYGFFYSYSQSKLANTLFTQELQRRVNAIGKKWIVSACHPGMVDTDIFRVFDTSFWKKLFDKVMQLAARSPAQGASTQVWLAASAEGSLDVRGQYLYNQAIVNLHAYAKDESVAERLWRESEERSGLVFDLSMEHAATNREETQGDASADDSLEDGTAKTDEANDADADSDEDVGGPLENLVGTVAGVALDAMAEQLL
ncbi:hypothetical protein MPSEU_000033800 [Mayamaea pseudoterrestris]|nr:hypothetical protein MPSEU_000033800 [Mayamaea pseudoterrestris]